jgi:PAS domain S-box-containing protein
MAEHIFLVDDEMLINMGLHSFLTKSGYTSSMFGSGEACLDALAEGNLPDVILMDINFGPGKMGGPEATMLINARYDIPVILHSAYTGKETLDQTKEMTRYGYIQKFPGNEQFVLANIEMAIKLHRSKTLYREMFQNSNDAIFLPTIDKTGLPGKFYEVNDVACRYLGYSREELLRMGPSDIDYGSDEEELTGIMRELDREKRITFEMNHRAKDGTIVPVEISSHQFVLDKKPIIISSVRDISLRKRMEKELRNSETLHRTTLSSISDTVFLTDEKGNFVYICPNVEVIFGYNEKEVWRFGNIKALFGTLLIQTEELDAAGEKPNIEVAVTAKEGTRRRLLVNVKRVSIMGAKRLYTCRDVTELKKSEQMYRELSNHLQNVREEQNAYIAREIHDDLGQSLTALKMNLTMVDTGLRKIEKSETVREIQETTSDMKHILTEIVAKIRALTSELRPPVLDTMGIVEALQWHTEEFTKQFGIKTNFVSTTEEAEIGEEKSLAVFRIVQEALTNSVRHGSPTEVSVSIQKTGTHITITVVDNGRGFAQEQTRQKNKYGLIGMQERARQFGGHLVIDSTPGAGTSVSLRVPV